MSKNANIIDIGSNYTYNLAENGTALMIMRNSTYTGTGITFDSNEAEIDGGAVFAT